MCSKIDYTKIYLSSAGPKNMQYPRLVIIMYAEYFG